MSRIKLPQSIVSLLEKRTPHLPTAAAFSLLGILAVTFDCSAETPEKKTVPGESLLLVKTEPTNLCFDQVVKGSLSLRSTFTAGKQDIGRLRRRPRLRRRLRERHDRRAPPSPASPTTRPTACTDRKISITASSPTSATTSGSSGPTTKRPTASPGRSRTTRPGNWPRCARNSKPAGRSRSSPTATASRPAARHRRRSSASPIDSPTTCRRSFPRPKSSSQDVSIPGYASQQGIDWFDQKVGTVEKPDLVLVGFGMNDHNKGGPEPEMFKKNLVDHRQAHSRAQRGRRDSIFGIPPQRQLALRLAPHGQIRRGHPASGRSKPIAPTPTSSARGKWFSNAKTSLRS